MSRATKNWLGIIIVTIGFSFAVLGILLADEAGYRDDEPRCERIDFTGTFVAHDKDGSTKFVASIDELDSGGFERIVATGHLSQDVDIHEHLIMRVVNCAVEVSVNGSSIYRHGEDGTFSSFADSPGNGWVGFVSPGISSADTVEFVLESRYANSADSSYEVFFENLHCGYEVDLVLQNLRADIPNLFLSLFIFSLGIVAVGLAIALARMRRTSLSILTFAALALSAGVWFFIDFTVQGYFIPFPVFNNGLDIVSMLLTGMFFMLYYASSLKTKAARYPMAMAAAYAALLVCGGVAQLTGVEDYYAFMGVIGVIVIIMFVVVAIALLREWRERHSFDTVLLGLSTLCVCVGVGLDVLLVQIGITTAVFWVKIGFLVLLALRFIGIVELFRSIIIENAQMKMLQSEQAELNRIVEYQQLLTEATRGLYDLINEFDLTHDCAAAEKTKDYFESLGLPRDATFVDFVRYIGKTQVEEGYIDGYLEVFDRDKLLRDYTHGKDRVEFEIPLTPDGKTYYWMRIDARLFAWKSDRSIRLISYRQNIDAEKRYEQVLEDRAARDAMTGLYNKVATERLIDGLLLSDSGSDSRYALFILDLDDFKTINDTLGHAEGDRVISRFAKTLVLNFHESDIVGRIGGDEFVAFTRLRSEVTVEEHARSLLQALHRTVEVGEVSCSVSASIGIAVRSDAETDFMTLYRRADRALYRVKKTGKDAFCIYEGE